MNRSRTTISVLCYSAAIAACVAVSNHRPSLTELAIDGPEQIDTGRTAILDLLAPAKTPKWTAIDSRGQVVDGRVFDSGQSFAVACDTPGFISVVVATGGVDGKRSVTLSVKTIVVGGQPKPRPEPGPRPNPGPPTPTNRKLVLFIVEETSERTQGFSQMIASKKLSKHIESKKHRWAIADRDASSIPSEFQQAFEKHRGGPVPHLTIFDGDKIVYEGEVPESDDKAIELLGKYGG